MIMAAIAVTWGRTAILIVDALDVPMAVNSKSGGYAKPVGNSADVSGADGYAVSKTAGCAG